jgi:hypothetical protein
LGGFDGAGKLEERNKRLLEVGVRDEGPETGAGARKSESNLPVN